MTIHINSNAIIIIVAINPRSLSLLSTIAGGYRRNCFFVVFGKCSGVNQFCLSITFPFAFAVAVAVAVAFVTVLFGASASVQIYTI